MMGDIVYLSEANKENSVWYKYSFVHEFGHVWDYKTGNNLSRDLMKELGTWIRYDSDYPLDPARYKWEPYHLNNANGSTTYPEPPPDTPAVCLEVPNNHPPSPSNNIQDCQSNPYSSTYGAIPLYPGTEDWAVSLGYYVIPEIQGSTFGFQSGSIRRQYVKRQIENLP